DAPCAAQCGGSMAPARYSILKLVHSSMAFAMLTLPIACATSADKAETAPPPVQASPPPQVQGPKPASGEFGFDSAGIDPNVKPGDDFFGYSGGNWMKNEKMPEDRTRWGTFDQLRAKSEADVRALVEEVAAKKGAPGSVEQKVGDYYAAY